MMRFVHEMLYGIQASGDTQLSSIVRAIDDDIEPIYTEKWLSRNIDNKDLERLVSSAILAEGARHVKQDTLRAHQVAQRAVMERPARGGVARTAMQHAAQASCRIRFTRPGMQRTDIIRDNACQTAEAP